MRKKVLYICIVITWWLTNIASAQNYFTEGTRWIELRLDTLKYDSWYHRNPDGTYCPNYEKREFYIHVDTVMEGILHRYGYVWQHVDGQPDSVRFVIEEPNQDLVRTGLATLVKKGESEEINVLGTIPTYKFGWHEGMDLFSQTMADAGFTQVSYSYSLGKITEVNEGCFGTDKILSYVDVDTLSIVHINKLYRKDYVETSIIKGIGVNKWKSQYCIMGPSYPANTTPWLSDPYMSILVHFERDGEVLYDLWPTPEGGLASHIQSPKVNRADDTSVYDLQGRKVEGKPSRGIYIIGGKKRVVE